MITIKALNDTLREMRAIYDFEYDKAYVEIDQFRQPIPTVLLETKDEKSGIDIQMRKTISEEQRYE